MTVPVRVIGVKFGTDGATSPLIVKVRGFPGLTGREVMVNEFPDRTSPTAHPELVIVIPPE